MLRLLCPDAESQLCFFCAVTTLLDLKPVLAVDSSLPLTEREGSFSSGAQCLVVIVLESEQGKDSM